MKYLSITEFKVIFEEWKSSGLSVRDYCLNTGFTECNLYYWKKKLQEKTEPNPNELLSQPHPRVDDDYSKDLAELLPHNLKKNEIL